MRGFLAAILFMTLFAIGCTEKNYYPTQNPELTTGQIQSPAPNAVIETIYHWGPNSGAYSTNCPFAYVADTIHTARVNVNFGGGALSARVYRQNSPSSSFAPIGSEIYPFAETFDIPISAFQHDVTSYFVPVNYSYSFYVTGLTMDSTVWRTDVVPFRQTIRSDAIVARPEAPTIHEAHAISSYQSVQVYWCTMSPGVDRTIIYSLREGTTAVRADTVAQSDDDYWTIHRIEPLAIYDFWIRSVNWFGLSAPSETLRVATQEPSPPYSVIGYNRGNAVVTLHWTNRVNWCDSLVVARRDSSGAWPVIRSQPVLPSNEMPNSYYDSTTIQNQVNYYRVGYRYLTGTWWSEDSTGVWAP